MVKQIKSEERVSEFGEVNTSEEEVKAMLDLVETESRRFDSRFLEPACGDGSFLIEILNRKLLTLGKIYRHNQFEFEKNCIVIISSIYGVDILRDNVLSAREKLFAKTFSYYSNLFAKNKNDNFLKSVKYLLSKNIIYGNALTLKDKDSKRSLIFSEWSLINNKLKRRDFYLSDLLACSDSDGPNLFSDFGNKVEIPSPIKTYPLINFDLIFEYAEENT